MHNKITIRDTSNSNLFLEKKYAAALKWVDIMKKEIVTLDQTQLKPKGYNYSVYVNPKNIHNINQLLEIEKFEQTIRQQYENKTLTSVSLFKSLMGLSLGLSKNFLKTYPVSGSLYFSTLALTAVPFSPVYAYMAASPDHILGIFPRCDTTFVLNSMAAINFSRNYFIEGETLLSIREGKPVKQNKNSDSQIELSSSTSSISSSSTE